MDKYTVDSLSLQKIANKLRTASKTTDQLTFPEDFENIIENLGTPKGVIWLEQDENGFPLKVDASQLKTIEDYNFYCNGLPNSSTYCNTISFILPTHIIKLGQNAFRGCSHLIEITIPDQVDSVEANCFRNCTRLKKITFTKIPSSTTGISSTALNGCSSIEDIYVPWTSNENYGEPWSSTSQIIKIHYKDK